ncbi:MAG: PLP-dependent aminotransferase family protein [Xanthomonadales bacterium]|nr:PLP-dependent aminotransferase family protein [Xanthomonadales bacterium]
MLFPIDVKVNPGRGASQSLHRQLREAILQGRLAAGLRMPATREVAKALGVARTTVVSAYDVLAAEGHLRARRGDGTFVEPARRSARGNAPEAHLARLGAPACSSPALRFDLRPGLPDVSLFPFDAWRRLESRAWRSIANAGHAQADPAGVARLRAAIVGHVSFARAVSCTVDDLVVTAGAQQAFDLLARTLVDAPGTLVAVEDPCYAPMRDVWLHAGARIVSVPVDEHGIDVARIPPRARVICVTPSHQFPLGVALSASRRARLLEHARRTGAYVVEDDYDSEYRYDDQPLDALHAHAPDRVCYVGTFSKTLFPALRLGYAVVPAALRARLLAIRRAADGFGAPAPQLALAEFIEAGHLRQHVRRMQARYAQRRTRLIEGLQAALSDRIAILPAKAGLHFSLRVSGAVDWARLRERADSRGLAFARCARYAAGHGYDDCCAIGFGALDDRRLASVVEHVSELLA